MSKSKHSRSSRSLRNRRPAGISRRRKKLDLSFETLEDRRVMSAESPLAFMVSEVPDSQIQLISYSSDTEAGKLATIQNEIAWQQLQAALTGGNFDVSARAIPTDPLLQDQWHLINTGQQVGSPNFQDIFAVAGEDINVARAWQLGVTGEGVVVAVIDSGVEFTHPDLAGNIDPSVQFDAITGDSNASPELLAILTEAAHGTAVAGLIGAVANNAEGGTGVAPGVQLVPIRLIDIGQTIFAVEDAFRYRTDLIDITNNSWGPPDIGALSAPSALEVFAIRDAVEFGRNGLGIIHVWASGNGASGIGINDAPDSSSYDGYVNSRYTIGVTGVDHDGEYNNVDGTVTSYPEIGPSVLVAAPTGSFFLGIGNDIGIGSGLLTTDTTNDTGFNLDPDPTNGSQLDFDYLENEAYTSRFNGTSGAAPIVSGVIALMLEANPNLSWRDVQDILVRSARQNAEFSTQADGLDKSTGIEYQNTWIINQQPLFHDPDPYDPLMPNELQQQAPILDPSIIGPDNFVHYLPTPQVLTNGAGFTVSQGRGTNKDQVGYAHGVIDAELAVQLAQQWTTKGQHLPDELTYTTSITRDGLITLPAAAVVEDLIIPGGFDGEAGFGAYWQEYFDDTPDFTPDFPDRATPLDLTVPSPNDMVIETVEVNVIVSGANTNDFVDNVRMVLVSPTGTHSEFNPYFVDPALQDGNNIHQAFVANGISHNPGELVNPLDSISLPANAFDAGRIAPANTFAFSFSTNRNWGERSDDALNIDPTTAEPVPGTGNRFNLVDSNAGNFMTQGWQLHFENYSTTPFTVDSIEVIWHGSPINEGTRRLQGLVGVDDNRDDLFNYSRVIQSVVDLDGDPTTLRLGEVQNYVDPNHESMGANVTVLAYRDVNGNGLIDSTDQLVDQFVTGADGNYYFDLVPDNYIIALDSDSLGELTPLDDSLSPSGILKDYQAQWAVSSDYFQVWDYDSNLEVPLDPATNAPRPLADATGNFVEYNVNHINFLLDPGAPVAPEVVFSGQVIADTNGDGTFNNSDTVAPGLLVFGDTNRNNHFDSGEAFTTTDANGDYTLVVPSTAIANINVGVIAPVDWTYTNPDSGVLAFFTEPGDTISGVDFALQPSAGPGVIGSALPGTILGFVFDDANEDRVRQSSEAGIPNVQVYIDNNDSGVNDAGDTVATTNANGAFVFSSVPVGTHKLRVDLSGNPTQQQTVPIPGFPFSVTITGENTVTGVGFGLKNSAVLDYGDLPEQYSTLFNPAIHTNLTGGARHTKGIFYLGSTVDAEVNGAPSNDALGDDSTGLNDEDGIFVDPLIAGATGRVEAIASRHGGYLQAWVDFNGDGDFNDVIGGVSERIFTNKLLDPGSNFLSFAIPNVIDADTVYARFRYGEFGLGLTGKALIGEVEDYVLEKFVVIPAHGPDFNEDGDVNGMDFLALQRGFGIQSNALPGNGDANDDGAVGMDDFYMWQQGFAGGTVALAAAQSSDDSDDGSAGAPLAAAMAPQVDSSVSNSTFEAFYGDEHGHVTTLGPRIVQPGFPEELPASVVDTGDQSTTPTRNELASIAGRVQVRAAYANQVRDSSTTEDRVFEELGTLRTDRALEASEWAFSRRQERIERPSTRGPFAADETEALAVALDEETDWLQI